MISKKLMNRKSNAKTNFLKIPIFKRGTFRNDQKEPLEEKIDQSPIETQTDFPEVTENQEIETKKPLFIDLDQDDEDFDSIALEEIEKIEEKIAQEQNEEIETPFVIDKEAIKEWHYPTNVPIRDYQKQIVAQALFKNTLVVLPTGLGK